jgi:N-acetylglucosaminyl-diphospho-decaprenol L-rhamnosyltransferase
MDRRPVNDRVRDVKRGLTSAIIVNFEGGPLLIDCLRSLRKQRPPLEVIIVDNGSADGSVDEAQDRFPDVNVVCPGHNVGFAGGGNAGAAQASGEFLLFLNPDVRLGNGCVEALVRAMDDPRVGVIGPVIYLETSDVLEYGCTIDVLGHPVGLRSPAAPLFVPGCALMTRSDLFGRLGGFDGRMFMFMEDIDYCWRALLSGSDIRVVTNGTASHVGGAVTPGGYLTHGRLATTRFRIVLRERNTLRMLVKCYGWPSAALAGFAHASFTGASALALWAVGHSETARGLVRGLTWNAAHLGETLALRKEAQSTRVQRDGDVRARMYKGLAKFQVVRTSGLPRIDEAWSPVPASLPEPIGGLRLDG